MGDTKTTERDGGWEESVLVVKGLREEEIRNLTTWEYSVEEEALSAGAQYAVNFIASALMIFSVVGNLAVIVVTIHRIFRLKKASSVHWFLCNLAVADILVTLTFLPVRVGWINMDPWKRGDVLCRILGFVQAFPLYLSGFVISCISIDRYCAFSHPFRILNAVRRGKIMLAVAWIGSWIMAIPELLMYHVEVLPPPQEVYCTPFGFFRSEAEEFAYNIMKMILSCGLPFVVMLVCYSRILWTFFFMDDIRRCSGNDLFQRAKIRAVKLFVIIALAYLICWTPTQVIIVWYGIDAGSALSIQPQVLMAVVLISSLNPCLNALIYGYFHLKA